MNHYQVTYTANQRIAAVDLLIESGWRFRTVGAAADGSPLGYWDTDEMKVWPKAQEFYSGAIAALEQYTTIRTDMVADRALANYYQR